MSYSPRDNYWFDQSPPALFRQGASALSRLVFFCSLAVFLMAADTRFHIANPLRSVLAASLYPLQWLALQPIKGAQFAGNYFQSLTQAQTETAAIRQKLLLQMQKTATVEQLQLENQRLRQLLELKQRPETTGIVAEVIYDAADPYTRKVVINKGTTHHIVEGSPVLDEAGVIGQVTRTHPFTSEVTLLIDKEQAIPVLNTRTGARSVAYGDSLSFGGTLELRFMAANADVQKDDLLTTTGIDGVYPAGLPIAKIAHIERRADTAFAKIHCTPVGKIEGASHVMVLAPLPRPSVSTADNQTPPVAPAIPNTLPHNQHRTATTTPTHKHGGKP